MFCLCCVVLCIVCVCMCVLNCCHRVAIQLQLNILYHILLKPTLMMEAKVYLETVVTIHKIIWCQSMEYHSRIRVYFFTLVVQLKES